MSRPSRASLPTAVIGAVAERTRALLKTHLSRM